VEAEKLGTVIVVADVTIDAEILGQEAKAETPGKVTIVVEILIESEAGAETVGTNTVVAETLKEGEIEYVGTKTVVVVLSVVLVVIFYIVIIVVLSVVVVVILLVLVVVVLVVVVVVVLAVVMLGVVAVVVDVVVNVNGTPMHCVFFINVVSPKGAAMGFLTTKEYW
jgi:hypothetical protein